MPIVDSTTYWPYWVQETYTTSTQTVWTNWVDQTFTHTTVTGYIQAYSNATDAQLMGYRQQPQARPQVQPRIPTAEELARRQAADEAIRRVARERAEAVKRAQEIMLRHLNPLQRDNVKKHGWFLVDGKSGEKYRLTVAGHTGNIERLDKKTGRVLYRYCCHARNEFQCPTPDHLLTQKFMLEHHEADFLKVANRW